MSVQTVWLRHTKHEVGWAGLLFEDNLSTLDLESENLCLDPGSFTYELCDVIKSVSKSQFLCQSNTGITPTSENCFEHFLKGSRESTLWNNLIVNKVG